MGKCKKLEKEKGNGKRKLTGKDKVFNVFNYGVFGLLTLICAYPFYYLIINTLSANDLSAAGEILFFPKGFHLDNYKVQFTRDYTG